MMANYAEIDGLPVIDNKKIARDLLRDTMGFEGMLTSDGAAVLKHITILKLQTVIWKLDFLQRKQDVIQKSRLVHPTVIFRITSEAENLMKN